METYYYHVTSKENAPKILKEGLKANKDGEIFLFSPNDFYAQLCIEDYKGQQAIVRRWRAIGNKIAKDECFLENYVTLMIDSKGINIEPIADDVAEDTAKYQWIVKQPVIESKFITLLNGNGKIYTGRAKFIAYVNN